MKKKILCSLISASMLTSFVPTLTIATETEENSGYVSVPVNLSEWYNVERTYYVSGNVGIVSKCIPIELYSDVTSDGTVFSRTKTTTTGHLSINGSDFIEKTDLWKTPWSDVVTTTSTKVYTNTLTFDGVDYNIGIPFTGGSLYTNAGSNYPTLVRTSSKTTSNSDTNYYHTYDIEDGYYKGVSFLGGAYGGSASSSSNYNDPYIRYVYDDGTKSNWKKLNAPPINPLKRSSSETAPYIELKSNIFAGSNVTKTVTEQTSADGVTWTDGASSTNTTALNASAAADISPTFYLNKIDELTADGAKKMTAIEVISRHAVVQKDLSLDPVKGSNNYQYGLDFIGMTLLTDEECTNNGYIADLKPIWEQKPDTFTGTSENLTWLEELNSAFEKINLDLVSDSETSALLNEIGKYIADVKNYTIPVYRYLEPSDFANRANWFLEEGDTVKPGANETNCGFEPNGFKALNTEDAYWENDWTEGMTENILTFRDYKYKINVDTTSGNYVAFKAYRPNIDGGKNSPPGDISSEDDLYYRFKVPTGYYEGISFLGGTDYREEMLAAVRLNYSDGSTSFVDVDLLQFTTKGTKEDYIKLDRTALNSETNLVAKTGSSLYLHQVNLAVDPTRILESIDLPIQSAYITDGEITGDGNTKYARYNYSYAGIGLKTNKYLASKIPTISSVDTTNDGKTAKVVFNFELPITEEIYNSASFTLLKDNESTDTEVSKSAVGNGEINAIALTFEHNMDFDAVWKINADIEGLATYTAYAPLKAPSEISNVVFYDIDGNTVTDLDTVTDSFIVEADVSNIGNENIYLALFNGKRFYAFAEANVTDGKLSNTFDVSKKDNQPLTLKALVWDSLTDMNPQNHVQDLTGINRLEQRRDIAEAYMRDMMTLKWRSEEDILYVIKSGVNPEDLNSSADGVTRFKINAGYVYQGLPYSYAGTTANALLDYSTKTDENGVHTISDLNWEKLSGDNADARVGNDCSTAIITSWSQFGGKVRGMTTHTMCKDYGYVNIGDYASDPSQVESSDVWANAPDVMYEAYAKVNKADVLVYYNSGGHSIMVSDINVVRSDNGAVDPYKSTVTYHEQTRKFIRANKTYYDEKIGEDVHIICDVDLKYNFAELYKSGFMPVTCPELVDGTAIEEPVIYDTVTEYNKDTMFEGTISSNWYIDSVTVTISDTSDNKVQEASLTALRWSHDIFEMQRFTTTDAAKIRGSIDIDSLSSGEYNCKVICRLITGETFVVRDFNFDI